MKDNSLTVDEAIDLVRKYSWPEMGDSCGHTGCEMHQEVKRRIHSTLGGLGADRNLDSVEAMIRTSTGRWWEPWHLLGHCLAIETDGRTYYYEVPAP